MFSIEDNNITLTRDLIIEKDNIGKTGINTYVYDITQGWL